ncbi:DNA ligase 1-like [Mytilus californianus]|uniref:DNA ligase 1-like n=1 Tax=Mytilus californianus TaxID=6549 RepID=UPI00224696CD|nr:DNA ligase 1-like [Mytilus californianus]
MASFREEGEEEIEEIDLTREEGEEEIEEIERKEEEEEELPYNMLMYVSDLCAVTDEELMQIIIPDEELDGMGEDEVMKKFGEEWSDEDLKTPQNNNTQQDLVMPAIKEKGKGKGKGKRTRKESNIDKIDEDDIPSTSTVAISNTGNRYAENDSDDELDELSV